MKPKFWLIHSTISSASRDTCTMQIAAKAPNSSAKSRSLTASRLFWHRPSKPSACGDALAVQRIAGAGQRGRTERQPVRAPAHVGQPFGVAREHLDVGQQVVREAHRLRDLHVRVARHHGVGVRVGQLDQRALHLRQQRRDAVDLAAQPQPHVGGHLVVARAAGVQPLAGVADQLRQPRLDVQVHVLELELPLEAAGFDLLRRSAPARARCRPGPARR